MFVVYSPEGQRFIGAAQNLPALKVGPIAPISKEKGASLKDMSLEPDHSSPFFYQSMALKEYQEVKKPKERTLIFKASEVMSSPVITIGAEANLYEAWALMKKHDVHHIPVLESGVLVGIFSKSDLLNRVILNANGQIEETRSGSVKQIMQDEVIATQPDADIREVAVALTKYRIGALPIITADETLVGIVTLSDLVKRLSEQPPIELYT